jgi:hypothetical protein
VSSSSPARWCTFFPVKRSFTSASRQTPNRVRIRMHAHARRASTPCACLLSCPSKTGEKGTALLFVRIFPPDPCCIGFFSVGERGKGKFRKPEDFFSILSPLRFFGRRQEEEGKKGIVCCVRGFFFCFLFLLAYQLVVSMWAAVRRPRVSASRVEKAEVMAVVASVIEVERLEPVPSDEASVVA